MLKEVPRVNLGNLPTPLHEAKNLAKVMGGPRILFKRDDAIGLVLGGQKVRQLDAPFGDAIAKGCDVIVTTGSEDAHHTSTVAAMANKLGMDIVMVFYKRFQKELMGNGLLVNILDPVIIETEFERRQEDEPKVNQKLDEIVEALRRHGRNPYKMYYLDPDPTYSSLSVIGFFYCAREIQQQLEEMGETAGYIYTAHAGGHTQGGLLLGVKYFGLPVSVVGTLTISGSGKEERTANLVDEVNRASELLGTGITVDPNEVIIHDEYLGPEGWGIFKRATKKGIEAIHLLAKAEGVFVDPHYTGRAMAAMLDDIREDKLTSQDTVIFYLTGGAPTIFSYAKELQLKNRNDIKSLYK